MNVFISYKHQDENRNVWVKKLATDLIEIYGVSCHLDLFDLKPGDSIYEYMQRIKTDSDVVLFIITPQSVQSVESNSGGISFDAQLWSTLRDKGKIRVIPIFREGDQTIAYVAAHLYIDFRSDGEYITNLKKLYDAITKKDNKPIKSIRYFEQFETLDIDEKIDFLNNLNPQDEVSASILAKALSSTTIPIKGKTINLLKSRFKEHNYLLKDFRFGDMVHISAGNFVTGENKEATTVYLHEYFIDKFPVTNLQYEVFVKNVHKPPPHYFVNGKSPVGKENHPVVFISWFDAVAYAEWCGKRLPSSLEWEKAASWDWHLNVKRKFPWGNEFLPNYCNESETGIGDTDPIGKYSPKGDSAYGVAEMAGNIREWTSSDFVGASDKKIVKGKSWNRLSTWGSIGIKPVHGPMPNSFYRFRCAFDVNS